MKVIITGIAAHILVVVLALSSAVAQQTTSATPVVRTPSTPSGLTIKQDFLAQQVAAIEDEIRVAERCVRTAGLSIRDVEGEINRVSSTDIINCGARLVRLQRALARLGVASEKAAEDAANEAEILAGLLKQKEMLQSISDSMNPQRRRR